MCECERAKGQHHYLLTIQGAEATVGGKNCLESDNLCDLGQCTAFSEPLRALVKGRAVPHSTGYCKD